MRLAFVAALLPAAVVAAAACRLGLPAWGVPAAIAALGLPLGLWLLGRVLGPAERALAALRDGVRGFHDHDYSLSIAAGRGQRGERSDELGELIELYNQVGDLLREERAALLQREVMLETVFHATPMAIVLTGGRRRILFANRVAREVFTAAGRLEGQSLDSLLEGCPAAMREALAGGRDAIFSVPRGDGVETYHSSRRAFELNSRRHELTLVKRLTPELRRQEVEVWKRAIRTMSHELNNSLAPIASLARSVRHIVRHPEHGERLDAALAVIEERALHLCDFLAGYARVARLPEPRREPVDWAAFLADLAPLFPFVVEGELPPRTTRPVRFDAGQMQQVLINLLKNAHESGSPPGEVRLRIEPTAEGGLRLVVADRGAGMSEEVLRSALLPFFTSKPAGSGLGLPICREIVEAHGGHLRIEHREEGGTAVVCWLPGE